MTGARQWRDGYFRCELDWSGRAIPANCPLVETRGEAELRFTVDQGRGRSAFFRLR